MNKITETIRKIFTTPELRKKILLTLGLLVVFRFAAHIPVPGVDTQALQSFFNKNQIFGLLDIFSGGGMSTFSIVMMGIAPYISASIIMQLLTMIVPKLEALQKEGERGQNIINQYTRFLTVPLAALEGYGMITLLTNTSQQQIIKNLTPLYMVTSILTITAGTMFLMWLGELITEVGIGNGISLIIFAGIISRIPLTATQSVLSITGAMDILKYAGFLLVGALIIFGVVIVVEAQRNIPVSYAKRVRGMRMYGGVSTYLPLRVNQAGVIPIIFAMSFMMFPGVIAKFLTAAKTPWIASAANAVSNFLKPESFIYALVYFFLVIGFTYFYTAMVFNPQNIAENLQKQGGFIPGIRPGQQTIEYLVKVSNRIMLAGGMFLGLIAILPFIGQAATGIATLTIGGTGLLIVVSVAIETVEQIKAQLAMRSYDNY